MVAAQESSSRPPSPLFNLDTLEPCLIPPGPHATAKTACPSRACTSIGCIMKHSAEVICCTNLTTMQEHLRPGSTVAIQGTNCKHPTVSFYRRMSLTQESTPPPPPPHPTPTLEKVEGHQKFHRSKLLHRPIFNPELACLCTNYALDFLWICMSACHILAGKAYIPPPPPYDVLARRCNLHILLCVNCVGPTFSPPQPSQAHCTTL